MSMYSAKSKDERFEIEYGYDQALDVFLQVFDNERTDDPKYFLEIDSLGVRTSKDFAEKYPGAVALVDTLDAAFKKASISTRKFDQKLLLDEKTILSVAKAFGIRLDKKRVSEVFLEAR